MPRKKKVALVQNSAFGDAIGFGQGQFGYPGNSRQPVSDVNPLYNNLRWYFVSNQRQVLSEIYAEIGLVQTIVNVPIDDGLRGGVMFKSKQLDEDELKQLQITMDKKNDLSTAGWSGKWSRLYGGGGILLIVDDQDPQEEFRIESITKDTEVEFRAIDMWEMYWDKQNLEGYDMTIQEHDFEYYSYYGEHVHKTRIMRVVGLEAPSFVRPRLRGWGLSVIESLVRSLNQYLKAIDLSYEVLDEFKIDVYKVKNLVSTLLSPNGRNQVAERIQMTNWQKNYQNAIVIDGEDDYDHKNVSFTGLADAMAGIRMQVASDLRMPITKLFGTSVSNGFSTDQNDMENYNSMVESEVRQKLKYDILRMAAIRCQQLFGLVPEDLEVEFKPLRELTATDQETVKTSKFARAAQALQLAIISGEEFRDICNKGNLFDIQLDKGSPMSDGLSPQDDAYSKQDDVSKEPMISKPETKHLVTE